MGEARIPGEKSAAIALNKRIDVGIEVIIYILCEIPLKLSLSKESKLFTGLLWVWGETQIQPASGNLTRPFSKYKSGSMQAGVVIFCGT